MADAALYLAFAFIPGVDPALVVIIVLFGVIVEMAGVLGVQIGASRRYDGPFGKSDRAVFFGALAVILAAGVEPGWWTSAVLALAAALALATIVNRARSALKEVGAEGGGL